MSRCPSLLGPRCVRAQRGLLLGQPQVALQNVQNGCAPATL